MTILSTADVANSKGQDQPVVNTGFAFRVNPNQVNPYLSTSKALGQPATIAQSGAFASTDQALIMRNGTPHVADIFQWGNGSGAFYLTDNLFRQAGNPISQPGATAGDNVLAVYTLPANSLDQPGRGIIVSCAGFLGNTTNTKTVKIIYAPTAAVIGSVVGGGGTAVATTGALTTTLGQNMGFFLQAQVMKFGVNGSNTQYAQEMQVVYGTTHGGMGVAVFPTVAENAPILLAITGNAATVTTDISLQFVEITATN